METAFFPVHIAGEIVLLTLLTGLAFWVVLTPGTVQSGTRFSMRPVRPQVRLGLLLAAWFAIVYPLASSGWISLKPVIFGVMPSVVPAIAVPTLAGILLLYSAGFRKVLDGVPLAWLAAFHGLRIAFGFVFLAIYELGGIPAAFAFRGGYGDILAGLLGLLTAYLYFKHGGATPAGHVAGSVARGVAALWIVVGLGDFLLVIYTGLTAVPQNSPFADFYPFMLIPAYVVPMFILTHVYAARALILGRK